MLEILIITIIILIANLLWSAYKRRQLEEDVRISLNRVWDELNHKQDKKLEKLPELDGIIYDDRGKKTNFRGFAE